jgi:hypothetical protein
MFDLAKRSLGEDWKWWLIPTHPEIRTNYFERVWTKQEIRIQRKTEKFEFDTDNSDPDQKLFAIDKRKS